MEERFKDIEDLIKEAELHHPSANFSKNVMAQIEASVQQKGIVYKPLISKRAWMIIATVISMLVITIAFLTDPNTSILNSIDLSFFNLEAISIGNPMSGFTFHKTTVYGILFLAALFFVQIPILKRRIDRSFSI